MGRAVTCHVTFFLSGENRSPYVGDPVFVVLQPSSQCPTGTDRCTTGLIEIQSPDPDQYEDWCESGRDDRQVPDRWTDVLGPGDGFLDRSVNISYS